MEESQLYSHHIFIFPFKWEQSGSEEQRFDIELFDKKLNKDDQWKENKFNLGQKDCYNEYNYFYRHVREILYEKSDDLIEEEDKTNDLIKHYEYKLGNITHYWIKVVVKDDTGKDKIVTYKLEIDSIILNIYATGTGVLSFHLRNKDYSDSEDVIKINQYGRRIYPPFLNINDKKTTERSFLDKEDKSGVPSVPRAELSSAIWLGGADDYQNNDSPYYDDFRVYDSCKNYKKGPFLIPKFIRGLFEQNSSEKTTDIIITPNKRDLRDKTDKHKYVYMDTVLDDRMYVVCWFGDNGWTDQLKQRDPIDNRYRFSNNERWYRYVFVDGGALTLQDPFLMQDTLIKNSYTRWIDYGTLYGVSRYSFVALTSDFETLQNNNASFTVKHVQSIYYKIAELCLLQRASILSYSEELSEIVKNLNGAINLEKVKGLYKRFMQFKTKICFDEVTAQDQGIEIYNLIRREMAIQLELESLEKRITEMYNYAALVEQENEKKETKRLNHIAMWLTALAVPSLLISILGITSMPSDIPDKLLCRGSFWPFWGGMILVCILTIIILVSIFWSKVKSRYNYLFQLLIVLLVIIYCSIGYLTFCII